MDYSVARFCDYMVEVEQRGDVPTTPGPVLTERAEHLDCERILKAMGVTFQTRFNTMKFLMSNHTFRHAFITEWSDEERWEFIACQLGVPPPLLHPHGLNYLF